MRLSEAAFVFEETVSNQVRARPANSLFLPQLTENERVSSTREGERQQETGNSVAAPLARSHARGARTPLHSKKNREKRVARRARQSARNRICARCDALRHIHMWPDKSGVNMREGESQQERKRKTGGVPPFYVFGEEVSNEELLIGVVKE